MLDLLIVAGAAIAGGLLIDLRKRLSDGVRMASGLCLLIAGWIAMVSMGATGPCPWASGAAGGIGVSLSGAALLALSVFRHPGRRRTPNR